MRYLFILLLLTAYFPDAVAQSADELSALYGRKEYDKAITLAKELIQQRPDDKVSLMILGRAYVDKGVYDPSLPHLQRAIALDGDASYISGWAHAYLGHAYLALNEKDKAIKELNTCIDLHKTDNSVKYAQHFLDEAKGGGEQYMQALDWQVISSAHITYYFEDTSELGMQAGRYVSIHDSAYTFLNGIFDANLSQKIKFFVFNSRKTARKLLQQELGFSVPERYECYQYKDQTAGHEMTHVLSYWAWGTKPMNRSRLVNEGVAVCFDLTKRDKYAMAIKAVQDNGLSGKSIIDIWEHDRDGSEKMIYPLGGAFMRYAYEELSERQFRAFLKDQTPASLKKLLGDKYDSYIGRFNKKIGLVQN